jgi:hypothetical protein
VDQAFQQVEQESGVERGVDNEGNITTQVPTGDMLGTPSDEIDRINGMQARRKSALGEMNKQGYKIGGKPVAEGDLQSDDPQGRGPAQKAPRSPQQPRTIYDPWRQPQAEGEPAQEQRAPAGALDPADAEFFGLQQAGVTDEQEGGNQSSERYGEYKKAFEDRDKWQAENTQRAQALAEEKENMMAALNLIRDPQERLNALQTIGVTPEELVRDLQGAGLVPGGPAQGSPEGATPEFGEDDDPRLAAMARANAAQASEIHRISGQLNQVTGHLRSREVERGRQTTEAQRQATLSGVKGYLSEKARQVPALKKSGTAELMVDHIMLKLERDFRDLPEDTTQLNQQAVGMLQELAVAQGLSPAAKARAAKASSRGAKRSNMGPTTPGRTLPPEAPPSQQRNAFNFEDDDSRRKGAMSWLDQEVHRGG